jgi:hypothetical protein
MYYLTFRVLLVIVWLSVSIPLPAQTLEPASPPPAVEPVNSGAARQAEERERALLRQEIERLQQEVAQLRAEVAWLRTKNTRLWALGPPPFLGFIPFSF